ncbi:MAG: hypothetical protein L0287_07275 [Anaerolineae bacterium]|nr:hypothetical protein [Anaerolineae bacterium]
MRPTENPSGNSAFKDKRDFLRSQIQLLRQSFVILLLAALILLGIVAIIRFQYGVPVEMFMDDPLTVARLPPYIGIVSNIGALLWCATASICLFSAAAIRNRSVTDSSFLLYSGFLTLYILIDDLFLLHEVVLEDYLHIPQIYTITVLGVFSLAYLYRYKDLILKTDYFALLMAFIFLGCSAIVDQFLPNIYGRLFIEDGFKFLGTVTWFGYYCRLSIQFIKKGSS